MASDLDSPGWEARQLTLSPYRTPEYVGLAEGVTRDSDNARYIRF